MVQLKRLIPSLYYWNKINHNKPLFDKEGLSQPYQQNIADPNLSCSSLLYQRREDSLSIFYCFSKKQMIELTLKRPTQSDTTRATAASGKAGARNSPDKPRAAVPFSFVHFFWANKRNGQTDLKGVKHLLCLPASRASLILLHDPCKKRFIRRSLVLILTLGKNRFKRCIAPFAYAWRHALIAFLKASAEFDIVFSLTQNVSLKYPFFPNPLPGTASIKCSLSLFTKEISSPPGALQKI